MSVHQTGLSLPKGVDCLTVLEVATAECTVKNSLLLLQEGGAVASIFAAPKHHDVFLIDCKEEECSWPLSTPATMIGYEAGQQLLVGASTSMLLIMHFGLIIRNTSCTTAHAGTHPSMLSYCHPHSAMTTDLLK